MNFKFWKLMFYTNMIMAIIITVSTYSWMTMWIGLEINMLCIIPLMNNTKNMFSTESSLKYFIIQAMASSMFLFSIILYSFQEWFIISMIMNSALLIKIGSAPFHFWFPEIMEGQKWPMCFTLLTIQKISPLILLNYNMNMPMFLSIIVVMNMIVSALMGLNQVSIRKILTFSSINHIGWMITSIFFMKLTWIIYFFIYIFILMNIISILHYLKIFNLKQMININLPQNFKLIFILNFFSLGGLPPFIGFMPKWLTIQQLMTKFPFLTSLMVMMTLLTLFYYTRMMLTSLVFSQYQKKNNFNLNQLLILTNFISLFILPLTCLILIT